MALLNLYSAFFCFFRNWSLREGSDERLIREAAVMSSPSAKYLIFSNLHNNPW